MAGPTPPPGFVLESSTSAPPRPPAGFVLEAPQAPTPVTQPISPPPSGYDDQMFPAEQPQEPEQSIGVQPPPGFQLEKPTSGFDAYEAAAKGIAGGITGLLGAAPKEAALSSYDVARDRIRLFDKLDAGEPLTPMEAAQNRHLTGLGPDIRKLYRQESLKTLATPVDDTMLYQVGESIKQSGKFQMPPGYEGQTWTGDLSSGGGSMIAGMGLALIPFVGPLLAGTAFLASGREEARERAKQAGQTPEMQARAANLGTLGGATDLLDIVILKTGTLGKAVGLIRKVGLKALESAFIESGQEGIQEVIQNAIEKGQYNPKKDLMEGVPRAAAVGGILGFGAGGAIGVAQEKFGRGSAAGGPDTAPQAPLTEEQLINFHNVLTGKTQTPEGTPIQEAPPVVPEGMVRMYHAIDSNTGDRTNTVDPAIAESYTKGGYHVGWVDIPANDPAVQSHELTVEQLSAITPIMSTYQQLQSQNALNVAQNINPEIGEPLFGRGKVSQALGLEQVVRDLNEMPEPNAAKVDEKGTIVSTEPTYHPTVQRLLDLRQKANDLQAEYELLKAGFNHGKLPPGVTAEQKMQELDREILLIENEIMKSRSGLVFPEHLKKPFQPNTGATQVINDRIFVEKAVLQNAMGHKVGDPGASLEAQAIGLAISMQRIAARMGLASNIVYSIHRKGIPGGGAASGQAGQLGNGKYSIAINLDSFVGHPNAVIEMQTTFLHELGHVIMFEHWQHAPPHIKHAIEQAYNDFLDQITPNTEMMEVHMRRANGIKSLGQFYGTSTDPLSSRDIAKRHYYIGFSEWFAEQVAKWGTTNAKPISEVERLFKNIADAILKAYAAFVQTISGGKFSNFNFGATNALNEWLNHFMDHGPELGQDIYTEMKLKEIEQGQKLMPSGVPVSPKTLTTASIMQKVTAVIPSGTPIPPTAQPPQSPPPNPPPPPSGQPGGAQPGGPAQAAISQMSYHADRMNRFYQYMASLSQLVTANPLFTPLVRYYEKIRQIHVTETRIQDMALQIARDWRGLGKQAENLTEFLHNLTYMSYLTPQEVANNVSRQPTQAELAVLARQHNLSPEAVRVAQKIKIAFDQFLNMNRTNAIEAANRTLMSNPTALIAKLQQINQEFANMASRPYFPFMRFGAHYVMVKDAAGRVVHFETFERRGLVPATVYQERARADLDAKKNAGEKVTVGKLPQEAEPFMGLPPSMLEHIKTSLILTPSQTDALNQLMLQVSPAMSFKHQFQKKNYTPGYSMEFRRSFARYFFHGARYYARAKYGWELNALINAAGGHGNKGDDIKAFMQDHLKNTILDARGDWGIFKGAMFLWALGYVPAAATQNLTQIPTITFPFLASKYGDIKSAKAMAAAMKDIENLYKKKGFYADPQRPTHADPQVEFLYKALGYGVQSGRITESQAADLAGMAGGGNLVAGIGGNKAERGWIQFQEKAAWMFEMAEQFNRRVTWRAALNLALQNPNSKGVREAVQRYNQEYNDIQRQGFSPAQAAAIVSAAYAVDQTQYVYARYDRPRFMRGPISGTIFVFVKYLQSTLFLLAQNPKDVLPRYLLVATAIGGLGGLPGYDDLREILKAAAARLFGKHFNLDHEIKKYVLNIAGGKVPPDLVLHGLARKGLGIPALLDGLGSLATGVPGRGLDDKQFHSKNIPFPELDRSKALTSSHILPFELGKLFYPHKHFESTIAEQTQKASGAAWSIGFNMVKFLNDEKLGYGDFKRWERVIPRQLADISKFYRGLTEGRERSRGGPNSANTVTRYNWRDPEQAMELFMILGGYRTAREAKHWDRTMAIKETQDFHDFMKERLLGQKFEAIKGGIQEEIRNVQAEIERYNAEVRKNPATVGFQITVDTQLKSMQKRHQEFQARESGIPTKPTSAPLHREMNKLYPSEVDRRLAPVR